LEGILLNFHFIFARETATSVKGRFYDFLPIVSCQKLLFREIFRSGDLL